MKSFTSAKDTRQPLLIAAQSQGPFPHPPLPRASTPAGPSFPSRGAAGFDCSVRQLRCVVSSSSVRGFAWFDCGCWWRGCAAVFVWLRLSSRDSCGDGVGRDLSRFG
ncbi:hypothetical protein Droror1_Dr00004496 [Drosera rotundifolia]